MKGEERRNKLTALLRGRGEPLSAAALAQACGVSRQVNVQDIALLRAAGEPIVSTHRGYLSEAGKRFSRVLKTYHTDEEIGDELLLIVRLGGTVEDVSGNHRVYGTLSAPLNIGTEVQIKEFLRSIGEGASRPLKNVTAGYHYHTVTADSQESLDKIEGALKERGYLVEA